MKWPASTRRVFGEAGRHAKMVYITYILLSKSKIKTYVGHTDDLKRRLGQHNRGKGTFSRRYHPWEVLYKEEFIKEIDSIKREKYFKSAAGRRWMKRNLFNN
ncbi:MAG: GIY-YIG nuclease family protein [Candidatus Levybacteria bacterium]|nr:GIY-YIG nuclease family protein [Candidatus Levybacteria bacterium]